MRVISDWLRRRLPSARLQGPASESIRRLKLPNSAWWDIETRPTMRQFIAIQGIMENGTEETAAFEVLAYLTDCWSFPDAVSAEAVTDRHVDEMIDAMSVFADDIVPFLERIPNRLKRNGSLSISRTRKSPGNTNTAS